MMRKKKPNKNHRPIFLKKLIGGCGILWRLTFPLLVTMSESRSRISVFCKRNKLFDHIRRKTTGEQSCYNGKICFSKIFLCFLELSRSEGIDEKTLILNYSNSS